MLPHVVSQTRATETAYQMFCRFVRSAVRTNPLNRHALGNRRIEIRRARARGRASVSSASQQQRQRFWSTNHRNSESKGRTVFKMTGFRIKWSSANELSVSQQMTDLLHSVNKDHKIVMNRKVAQLLGYARTLNHCIGSEDITDWHTYKVDDISLSGGFVIARQIVSRLRLRHPTDLFLGHIW